MAVYETTRAIGLGQAVAGRLSRAIHNITALVINWNDNRTTRLALSKLTDRELADIGLSRGDIERIC